MTFGESIFRIRHADELVRRTQDLRDALAYPLEKAAYKAMKAGLGQDYPGKSGTKTSYSLFYDGPESGPPSRICFRVRDTYDDTGYPAIYFNLSDLVLFDD